MSDRSEPSRRDRLIAVAIDMFTRYGVRRTRRASRMLLRRTTIGLPAWRRQTCPNTDFEHRVLTAGVHRLRVSGCIPGTLDLFGVLTAPILRRIIGSASFLPTDRPTKPTVKTLLDQAAINSRPPLGKMAPRNRVLRGDRATDQLDPVRQLR
jgi:hypothetical protein